VKGCCRVLGVVLLRGVWAELLLQCSIGHVCRSAIVRRAAVET